MANATKLLTVLMVTALAAEASAQRAQFEVASVKVHASDDQRTFMVAQPGGRFVAANISLRFLMRAAFQLQEDQIVGGPDWLATNASTSTLALHRRRARPAPSYWRCSSRSWLIGSG
jgi:hypothetical protein